MEPLWPLTVGISGIFEGSGGGPGWGLGFVHPLFMKLIRTSCSVCG